MQKERLLLQTLQEHQGWMKTSVLASICHVSTRTIRKYVAILNTEQPYILSSSLGYRFNPAIQEDITQQDNTLESSDDRVRCILHRLLHRNESINRYDLCDEIFISPSTLKNDLGKVKEQLHEYDLYLHQSKDMLWCEGHEKNRRKMVSAMLYQESNAQFMNDDLIKKAFSHLPVAEMKQILIELFHEVHYFTNDYSLSNLLLHLCISIDRIQQGYSMVCDTLILPEDTIEYQIALRLGSLLETLCSCHISKEELYELSLLIMSRSTRIDTSSNTAYTVLLSDKEQELITNILQEVNHTYYVNLNHAHFLQHFSLHIHNLLIRVHTRYFAKNSLTKEMKLSFPLLYDISVFIANMIEAFTSTKINDDEIAYIALHIGSCIDETTNEHNKINTVILCPQYYDFDHQLLQKIKTNFSNELVISELVTSQEELEQLHNYQLLLTTYQLQRKQTIPYLVIHPLLTSKDIDSITRWIKDWKNQEKNSLLKQHLTEIFPEKCFIIDQPFSSRDDAMIQMSNLLVEQDIVDQHFYCELMERESLSSTAFDHFAIPHSLAMHAKKTSVCTSIHHHPIPWGDHQVHFIFMISVNHLERKIFKDIFSSLTDVLIDPNQMALLLQATRYKEFIDILSNLL